MNKQKKKRNVLPTVILVLCSAALGGLIGYLGALDIPEGTGSLEYVMHLLLQFLLLVLAYILQLIIHEAGHLAAGLMTGYRFSSFRIGSLVLLKTREGYSLRRFTLPGTGGQCLLIPPEPGPDGAYPYRLYHLGGVLMNLITAVLFFFLYRITPTGLISSFFLYLAISGLLCAVTNGIPLRINGLANDGFNVLHIGKEPFALEAMWIQLKLNEAQTEGTRLKDLPEEWFLIPDNADKTNEIISSIAVFRENRAMDALDFAAAKDIIRSLEEDDTYRIIGLYQNLLLFDRVTIDLIERGAEADLAPLEDPKLKGFRKAMAKFPASIRTEYAARLLKENDPDGAQKCMELFRTVARRYPTRSDIESEEEIMQYIASRKA